jgi:hypothetical protein
MISNFRAKQLSIVASLIMALLIGVNVNTPLEAHSLHHSISSIKAHSGISDCNHNGSYITGSSYVWSSDGNYAIQAQIYRAGSISNPGTYCGYYYTQANGYIAQGYSSAMCAFQTGTKEPNNCSVFGPAPLRGGYYTSYSPYWSSGALTCGSNLLSGTADMQGHRGITTTC